MTNSLKNVREMIDTIGYHANVTIPDAIDDAYGERRVGTIMLIREQIRIAQSALRAADAALVDAERRISRGE